MAQWLNEEALDVLVNYYYPRADYLQHKCNWGKQGYRSEETIKYVNDDLMTLIDIYDCSTRNAAGFSNVLQDLKFMKDTPKRHHQNAERRAIIDTYDTKSWDTRTWLYVYLTHRITGSGASFTRDHGYRNNAVQHFGSLRDINDMKEYLADYRASGKPLFTSIGNQPPAPRRGVSNFDFMKDELPNLVDRVLDWLNTGQKKTHKAVTDFMNEYNLEQGHRRFNFVYAAFSYDLGDYHKDLVDDQSHGYFGNNAIRCMKLLSGGYSTDQFMDILVERTGGAPRDLEDVTCDFVRFGQNYIPRSDSTFDHVPSTITNNSKWNSGFEQRQGKPNPQPETLESFYG